MGLLDFLRNQPQMADPHANARRLMGGAIQAPQPTAQPAVQRQSILPQGTPQQPSMTPYQQPQNIGSGVMGYDRDRTGINNVGMQNTSPEAVNLETFDNPEIEDSYTTFANGQVLQGQGNDTSYVPMDATATAYPQAFVTREEAGGAVNPTGTEPQPAEIPLSVITGDTKYTESPTENKSLLGTGGNFGFTSEGDEVNLTDDEAFSLFSLLAPDVDREELIRRGIINPKL